MDVRDIVDNLLATAKTPVGRPEWQQGPRVTAEGQLRWLTALGIDGEVCPLRLIVDAYPKRRDETFRIIIEMGTAITRVDYGPYEDHFNGGRDLPPGIRHGLIVGPHYHSWADNRRFATSRHLPGNLRYARPLPTQTKGFANVYRWLCGEANILCGSDIPELPQSDMLP